MDRVRGHRQWLADRIAMVMLAVWTITPDGYNAGQWRTVCGVNEMLGGGILPPGIVEHFSDDLTAVRFLAPGRDGHFTLN